VHRLLATTSLRALPLWLLGSDPDEQRAVRAAAAKGAGGSPVEYRLALAALAERRFDEAAERLARVAALGQPPSPARELRVYALAMAGRRGEAARLAAHDARSRQADGAAAAFRAFLAEAFGFPSAPRGAAGP
jgi:hypothetical protein